MVLKCRWPPHANTAFFINPYATRDRCMSCWHNIYFSHLSSSFVQNNILSPLHNDQNTWHYKTTTDLDWRFFLSHTRRRRLNNCFSLTNASLQNIFNKRPSGLLITIRLEEIKEMVPLVKFTVSASCLIQPIAKEF